jgi:hypothetical protein
LCQIIADAEDPLEFVGRPGLKASRTQRQQKGTQ